MRVLLLFFFVCGSLFGQEYEIVAAGQYGVPGVDNIKYSGNIKILDSLVLTKFEGPTGMIEGNFDITNKRNNAIYITDGTLEFKILVWEDPKELKLKEIDGKGKIRKIKEKSQTTHVLQMTPINYDQPYVPVYYCNVIE